MKTNIIETSIIQCDLAWESVDENISRFDSIIKTIKEDPHIVILPEMFTTGFTMNPRPFAEPSNGKTTQWLLRNAKEYGFAICGSIIIVESDKYYNRFLFATPAGELFEYNKRHLFSIGKEHIEYTSGSDRVVIDYLGWRILPQICYDLRFPVWSRNRNDYDLMINVANFPGSRREVWNTLLKARAIENQCYVAAANRVGIDGMNISYTGDSQLVNARGQVVAQQEQNEEGIISTSFNLKELIDFRIKFPVLPDADEFSINL